MTLQVVPDTSQPIGYALRQAGVPREHVAAATEVLRDRLAEAARMLDSARRWAIEWQGDAERLGQEKAELLRRITLAGVYLEEVDCACEEIPTYPGFAPFLKQCGRCQLETILSGDE